MGYFYMSRTLFRIWCVMFFITTVVFWFLMETSWDIVRWLDMQMQAAFSRHKTTFGMHKRTADISSVIPIIIISLAGWSRSHWYRHASTARIQLGIQFDFSLVI